ncbi:MAG: hypothetical protein AAF577_01710 [Pseudomonadota bacterium]
MRAGTVVHAMASLAVAVLLAASPSTASGTAANGTTAADGADPDTTAAEMVELVIERCAVQMMNGRHPDTNGLAEGEDTHPHATASGAVGLAVLTRDDARFCDVVQRPDTVSAIATARVFSAVGRWASVAIAEESAFLVDDCPEGAITAKLVVASEEPVRRGRHLMLLLIAEGTPGALKALIGEVDTRPEPACFEEAT